MRTDEGCRGREPCPAPEECRRAALCLGSPEGVAYQEAHMKRFFEWLLPQYAAAKAHVEDAYDRPIRDTFEEPDE